MRHRITAAAVALGAAFAALPAFAHEGDHEQMPLAQAVRHLLTEPDHQLELAGLVVLAVVGTWAWARRRAAK